MDWDDDEMETRVIFDGTRTMVMPAVPQNEQPSLVGLSISSPPPRSDNRGLIGWLVALGIASAVCAGIIMRQSATLRVELVDDTRIATAEVFIDGRRRCTSTPCIVRDLAPGEHSVRILAEGHSEIASVSVAPFGEERVVLSVPEQRASLRVDGAHEWMTLSCDGQARGALPLTLDGLAPGTHELRFEGGPRYRPLERSVVLRPGQSLDLGRVALELKTGVVHVEVEPAKAQVWLRGEEARELTAPFPCELELAPGDYEVVAARRGYRSVVRPIRVDAMRPEQRVSIILKPTDWARDDIWQQ